MLDTILLMIFPLCMAYAASSDLLTMRISNKVILGMLAGFAVVALAMGLSWPELGWHLLAGVGVLMGAFAMFALGWIGGGDAKLAAATTLWLGFAATLPYLVYAALLGGVLTLAILMLRRLPLPPHLSRFAWIERLHDTKSGVPYGIALAASGLIVYAHTPIFQHFTA